MNWRTILKGFFTRVAEETKRFAADIKIVQKKKSSPEAESPLEKSLMV